MHTTQDATHKDKTHCVSITYLCLLMVFKPKIAIYSENHMQPTPNFVSKPQRLLIVKAGGTYRNHYALKASHAGRKKYHTQSYDTQKAKSELAEK